MRPMLQTKSDSHERFPADYLGVEDSATSLLSASSPSSRLAEGSAGGRGNPAPRRRRDDGKSRFTVDN